MKIKARDIIQGWPRGRSTTTSYDNRFWQRFDYWPYLNRTSIAMLHQLGMERVYHQMQQAMVHEWFAMYRLTDNPLITPEMLEWFVHFGIPVYTAIRNIELFLGDKA